MSSTYPHAPDLSQLSHLKKLGYSGVCDNCRRTYKVQPNFRSVGRPCKSEPGRVDCWLCAEGHRLWDVELNPALDPEQLAFLQGFKQAYDAVVEWVDLNCEHWWLDSVYKEIDSKITPFYGASWEDILKAATEKGTDNGEETTT